MEILIAFVKALVAMVPVLALIAVAHQAANPPRDGGRFAPKVKWQYYAGITVGCIGILQAFAEADKAMAAEANANKQQTTLLTNIQAAANILTSTLSTAQQLSHQASAANKELGSIDGTEAKLKGDMQISICDQKEIEDTTTRTKEAQVEELTDLDRSIAKEQHIDWEVAAQSKASDALKSKIDQQVKTSQGISKDLDDASLQIRIIKNLSDKAQTQLAESTKMTQDILYPLEVEDVSYEISYDLSDFRGVPGYKRELASYASRLWKLLRKAPGGPAFTNGDASLVAVEHNDQYLLKVDGQRSSAFFPDLNADGYNLNRMFGEPVFYFWFDSKSIGKAPSTPEHSRLFKGFAWCKSLEADPSVARLLKIFPTCRTTDDLYIRYSSSGSPLEITQKISTDAVLDSGGIGDITGIRELRGATFGLRANGRIDVGPYGGKLNYASFRLKPSRYAFTLYRQDLTELYPGLKDPSDPSLPDPLGGESMLTRQLNDQDFQSTNEWPQTVDQLFMTQQN